MRRVVPDHGRITAGPAGMPDEDIVRISTGVGVKSKGKTFDTYFLYLVVFENTIKLYHTTYIML